jgi:hypothetical protein
MVLMQNLRERCGTSPRLSIFKVAEKAKPMEETIRKTELAGSGVSLATNRTLDAMLQVGGWKALKPAFPCYSGTLFAYEEPGKPLGEKVSSFDHRGVAFSIRVPDEHIGKSDAVLVAECQDIHIVRDSEGFMFQAKKMDLVQDFPVVQEGWFYPDPIHGIPSGPDADPDDPSARYLWRSTGPQVGLVLRTFYSFFDHRFEEDFGPLCVGMQGCLEGMGYGAIAERR